ncbi:MAG: PAS domain-containing sensor histidine kinase, partial [Candidatus Hodarchaeales archaeon]
CFDPDAYDAFMNCIHPEDRENLAGVMEKALSDPAPFVVEYRIKLPDGNVRYIHSRGEVSCDETGKPDTMFGSSQDITERKYAEEALLKSEHEKALILQSTSDVIVYQDPDFKILWANEAAGNYIGLKPEEMVGKYCFDLWRHQKEPCTDCPVVDALKTGEIQQRENITLDGRIWIDRGYPVRDEDGAVIGAVEVSTDITARKLMEDELRQSEEKFRNIIEFVPIGMLMYQLISGEKLVFYDANPAAAKILGVDTEQFIGKTIEEAFPPLAETEVPERYRLAASKGVTWQTDEIVYQDDQISGAYEVHAFQTAPDKMAAAFLDITDRKRAEVEREALIADLEAKNAELERFVYTVSHDLKSPLITIMGFLGFLAEDLKNGDINRAEEDIKRISNAGKRMQQLLDELLELSRIGRLDNPPQWVTLSELANQAFEMVKGQQKGGLIDVKIAPNLPRVYGDSPRLLEVYVNLIDNAIKFIGDFNPDPRIEIGFYHKNDEIIYYVKDNGLGIEPRYHKKVFELFQRLDQRYEGTGVGLAIVKRIIEAHGGRIWIESKGADQGSTFYFTLEEKDESSKSEE